MNLVYPEGIGRRSPSTLVPRAWYYHTNICSCAYAPAQAAARFPDSEKRMTSLLSETTIDCETEKITPLAGAAFSGNWKLFHEVYDSYEDWAENGWSRSDVSSTRMLVLDSHIWCSEYPIDYTSHAIIVRFLRDLLVFGFCQLVKFHKLH